MSLAGRINLILTDISPETTTIVANTRYAVTKTIRYSAPTAAYRDTSTESISFNSGEGGTFPSGTHCVATGDLERGILESILEDLQPLLPR